MESGSKYDIKLLLPPQGKIERMTNDARSLQLQPNKFRAWARAAVFMNITVRVKYVLLFV